MNYSKIFKRQTFVVVASVCALIMVFAGVSYALFQKNLQGSDLVINTGTLKITFHEGTVITDDLVPMSDSDGKTNGNSYTFTVDNSGSLNVKYQIQIYNDKSATGTLVPHQYVMLSLDGGNPVKLSDLTKDSGTSESDYVYVLGTGTIAAKTGSDTPSNTHTVRVWIKSDAPASIIGNVVALKLNVISEVQGT